MLSHTKVSHSKLLSEQQSNHQDNILRIRTQYETKIKETKILDNIDLNNLFKMTPYYHKTSKKDILKLEQIKELKVSFSFIIDLYQNRT